MNNLTSLIERQKTNLLLFNPSPNLTLALTHTQTHTCTLTCTCTVTFTFYLTPNFTLDYTPNPIPAPTNHSTSTRNISSGDLILIYFCFKLWRLNISRVHSGT